MAKRSELLQAGEDIKKSKGVLTDVIKAKIREGVSHDCKNGLDDLEGGSAPSGERFKAIRDGYKAKNGQYVLGRQITIEEYSRTMWGVEFSDVLASFGINTRHSSFSDLTKAMNNNSEMSLNGVMVGDDVSSTLRWLVREVFLSAVIRGFQASSAHMSWISGTDNVDREDGIVVPQLLDGNTKPEILREGESISFGMLKYDDKKVNTIEFGKGIAMTDKLLRKLSIDTASQFISEMGRFLALAEGSYALFNLINGEQTDGSENIYTVGVDTVASYTEEDIMRATAHFEGLGYNPDTLIGRIDDLIAIGKLPIFRGTDGVKEEGELVAGESATNFYNPQMAVYGRSDVPADQVLMLASSNAMRRIEFMPLQVETERTASRRTNSIYVTGHTGYYIQQRNARVAIDKSIPYVGNEYPLDMNPFEQMSSVSFF